LLLSRRAAEVPHFLSRFWGNEVRGVTGDIHDLPHLLELIESYQVESIVHGANYQFDVSGQKLPLYDALNGNLKGTANLLEAALRLALRRVSFISSETVYFGLRNVTTLHEDLYLPMTGDADMDIAGVKRLCEQICILYAQRYGLSVPILRLDRLYGPLSHGRRFPIRTMVENAMDARLCDLSDFFGGDRANYTYIKDAAKGVTLVHLAPTLAHQIYNVAEGAMYSYIDFVEAIRGVLPHAEIILGSDRPLGHREYPPLSIERIQKEMGFVPDYDLKRAVRHYIVWLKEGTY